MISAHDLFDALAALGGDGLGIIHIAERFDGGAHHVDRVGRTDAYRQHVAHAQHFEYRAHRTAGDDTGTLGGRLHEHLGRAVARHAGMLQGRAVEFDVAHVAARVFHRLGDGGRHFARLAATETDPALAVAHHRQCREAEDTTTLHDLGDAAHRDQFFLESITAIGGVFKTHHNEFP